MYEGNLIKTINGFFLPETLQAKREWHDTLKMLKEKIYITKNSLLGKVIIQN